MSKIIQRNGNRYLVIRRADRKGWKVSRWCDCGLGPHWHMQDDARRLGDVGD